MALKQMLLLYVDPSFLHFKFYLIKLKRPSDYPKKEMKIKED